MEIKSNFHNYGNCLAAAVSFLFNLSIGIRILQKDLRMTTNLSLYYQCRQIRQNNLLLTSYLPAEKHFFPQYKYLYLLNEFDSNVAIINNAVVTLYMKTDHLFEIIYTSCF